MHTAIATPTAFLIQLINKSGALLNSIFRVTKSSITVLPPGFTSKLRSFEHKLTVQRLLSGAPPAKEFRSLYNEARSRPA
jgi:hypothetical protein